MKTIDSILKPLQKALQKAEAIEEHNAAESKRFLREASKYEALSEQCEVEAARASFLKMKLNRFLDEDDTNVCA